MNLTAVEKVVGKIQSSLFKNSNHFSIGMLKSHFKGSGLQFKEHQVYTHGDDVRFLDWKMLAKTNNPYIKTFEEERNVEIVVFLDIGPSMLMGHNGITKLQAAVEITCLLYLLAQETDDLVKCNLVGNDLFTLPSKRGKEGIVMLVSELEKHNLLDEGGNYNVFNQEHHRVNTIKNENYIKQSLMRKKEVVLLSDFYNYVPHENVRSILYNRNLHCFQLISPFDEYKKRPFSIFSISSERGKLIETQANTMSEKLSIDLKNSFGNKFKKLKLESRYLEDFVKEML